jgi:hypothetical protein
VLGQCWTCCCTALQILEMRSSYQHRTTQRLTTTSRFVGQQLVGGMQI